MGKDEFYSFAKTKMRLNLYPMILRIVINASNNAYTDKSDHRGITAYMITKKIEEMTDYHWKPSPGSIYPIIKQLEENSYVSAVEGETGVFYYRITDAGKEHLTRFLTSYLLLSLMAESKIFENFVLDPNLPIIPPPPFILEKFHKLPLFNLTKEQFQAFILKKQINTVNDKIALLTELKTILDTQLTNLNEKMNTNKSNS